MTNQSNNQSLITSTDVIPLTLTLKMTTAQVVETSVIVNNSPIQDYVYPDDHAQHAYETPYCYDIGKTLESLFSLLALFKITTFLLLSLIC